MVQVRTVHTADLGAAVLEAVRVMVVAAFEDLTSDDWEHALGGMHALAWEGGQLAGHASVVQRRLLTGGRALRTGYVEAVAVPVGRRGRGYGAAVMTAAGQQPTLHHRGVTGELPAFPGQSVHAAQGVLPVVAGQIIEGSDQHDPDRRQGGRVEVSGMDGAYLDHGLVLTGGQAGAGRCRCAREPALPGGPEQAARCGAGLDPTLA